RLTFILAGVTLVSAFEWVIYVFGAFLVFTGVKMAFQREPEVHPEGNPILNFLRRFIPVTKQYHGGRFFVKIDGKRVATPLFVVVVALETTDLAFAVDSIPAVLAISRDPFIVYTSNVFAILGLRSLYFALAGLMRVFAHLHYGLAAILVFVGAKMLAEGFYHIPIGIALGVVLGILALSIVASLLWPSRAAAEAIEAAKEAGQSASAKEGG
ncbi:MAG: TerC/Alx family metal homeostasis membrane protein, partial [Methanobacteriota archaeon]